MQAQIDILRAELELLHGELTLSQSSLGLDGYRSQLGQDKWVLEQTEFKRDGYFVEFGATNGVLLSNTWVLEKKYGWRGILCEPNPRFFEELKQNRAVSVGKDCVGPVTGEQIQFVFANAYGGDLQYALTDGHAAKRQAYRDNGQVGLLTTISLEDLLLKYDAPRVIDYLSIDTEGSEFAILEKFPFDQWDIRLITVEHNYTEQRAKIAALLAANGYVRTEQKWDDWYAVSRE